jgi:4-methyl-5(b-hydroxyethyl)-thiazole monophosphate biosynthesis
MASVLVPLAQGCEELEAVTIIDLLVRAGVDVVTAGLEAGPVTASRGVVLVPQMTLDEALERDYDMVVLPGGMPGAEHLDNGMPGAEHLDNDARIAALLRRMADSGRFTAAICAAPRVLANAGLLAGKRATSYPGHLDRMNLPDVSYQEQPVVQDGKVITSRGPGTAMDFTLTLIEQLVGREKRDEVEAALQRP